VGQAEGRVQKKEKKKEEGWQCLRLPALWANVMVCGYPGRFVSF